MDEPFDGFDLRQTREIMHLLRDAGEAAGRALRSCHSPAHADAERICDRFLLLAEGHVSWRTERWTICASAPTSSLAHAWRTFFLRSPDPASLHSVHPLRPAVREGTARNHSAGGRHGFCSC